MTLPVAAAEAAHPRPHTRPRPGRVILANTAAGIYGPRERGISAEGCAAVIEPERAAWWLGGADARKWQNGPARLC
ncbi:MAG: hypothetical protein WB800_04575, partial [Streptosporangiaceae bacterium]